jgi:GTPase SAR1 family protein
MWKKDIDDKVRTSRGQPVPTLLTGNKIDLLTRLENWEQTRIEIEEFTQTSKFLHFFETSAKDGTNVNEAIMCLVDHIMRNKIESEADIVPAPVGPLRHQASQKAGGCCK